MENTDALNMQGTVTLHNVFICRRRMVDIDELLQKRANSFRQTTAVKKDSGFWCYMFESTRSHDRPIWLLTIVELSPATVENMGLTFCKYQPMFPVTLIVNNG